MYEALVDADVEAEMSVVPGAGHGFVGDDAAFALDRTVAWFRRHLVPGGSGE